MNARFSRFATSLIVAAAVVLTVGQAWAVYFPLGPSKDEYGLKYNVELSAVAAGDTVDVAFTLADEGRLGPVYSYTVVAFSPRGGGSFAYDLKSKITLTTTADGKRVGHVRIPGRFVDKAMIRALTLNVNGKRQTEGAAYYDIPLNRYTIKTPAPQATTPSVAAPPTTRVIK